MKIREEIVCFPEGHVSAAGLDRHSRAPSRFAFAFAAILTYVFGRLCYVLMRDPSERRSSGPARDSRARQVVAGKRRNLSPETLDAVPKPFRGWNSRGYLPHRDEPGLTQLVTFRLADSLPLSRQTEWRSLFEIPADRERRVALEAYLDRGYGKCWLNRPEVAELTDEALRHFNGLRYELKAWAIMPNHVHVLFEVGEVPMAKTVESWKKYIAIHANRLLRLEGAFWQSDYWDTFMRDGAHEERARIYVEENPVKARLVERAADWAWGSARFRNEAGNLE